MRDVLIDTISYMILYAAMFAICSAAIMGYL